MSIIDNLVYDRTQADVDRVFTLKNKILTEGLSSLSAEEKTEYMAGMKGAYNYGDMNRVGQAVAYIANRMTSLPGQLAAYRAEKESLMTRSTKFRMTLPQWWLRQRRIGRWVIRPPNLS